MKRRSSQELGASRLVRLATMLAEAPDGFCKRCSDSFSPSRSAAQIARCFCSPECEQTFIRERIESLGHDDLDRIYQRLDTLLKNVEGKIR